MRTLSISNGSGASRRARTNRSLKPFGFAVPPESTMGSGRSERGSFSALVMARLQRLHQRLHQVLVVDVHRLLELVLGRPGQVEALFLDDLHARGGLVQHGAGRASTKSPPLAMLNMIEGIDR